MEPERLPDDVGDRFIQQALQFWIQPEIERRRAEGRLPEPFAPSKIQVIFNPDPPTPEVRFDDEVRAALRARFNRPIAAGEWVTSDDIAEIVDIELTDRDPDAGHLTMVFDGARWVVRFDFRRNATLAAQTLAAAQEFFDCAAYSLRKHHLRSFADTLFSAMELLAKAHLLPLADKPFTEAKKHTAVATRYNLWGKLGNADPRGVALLNRLAQLRGPARYLEKDLVLTADEARDMLAIAKALFKALRASLPKRVRVAWTREPAPPSSR